MTASRLSLVVRPAEGGMKRHVTTLIERLPPFGFHITLYAPTEFSLDPRDIAPQRVDFDINPQTHPVRDLLAANRLSGMLRGSADLVHAHGLRAAAIAVPAAARARIPSVVTLHNMAPGIKGLRAAMVSKILQRADRVIAVSRAQQESFDFAHVLQANFVVIPNGVEPGPPPHLEQRKEARRRLGIPEDDGVILAVGRLAPEKGIDLLISAFGAVLSAHPNALLVLVGSGESAQSLQQLASATAPGRIRFEGYIPDPLLYYAAADMVAVPSRSEGQGITALEGMERGLPVVASNTGGLTESITDGINGRLLPEGDVRALAQCLTELLRDPAERERLGRAARERAIKHYSIDASIQSTVQVYRSILDKQK